MLDDDLDNDWDVVRLAAASRLPTQYGTFNIIGYEGREGEEHVALTMGLESRTPTDSPLVRVHSECLTGDALGSLRCDCGEQLDASLKAISEAGSGVVIYVRGHEGRGIGLFNKLRAYALQDQGMDTVDANTHLGLPIDSRSYDQSAAILRSLGIESIRLLSSNPAKQVALEQLGIIVESRVRLNVTDRVENSDYLATKRARMRHDAAPVIDAWESLLQGAIPNCDPGSDQQELVERYAPLITAGTSLVIGQLGQSIDGFIASRTGDARFVTGSADREHLHRLRALVDAVVVGAQTVTTDDCQLTVRAVNGRNPVRVVLDPTARIPADSILLTAGEAPTLWVVGPEARVPAHLADHVEVHRMATMANFSPNRIIQMLSARGLGRMLIEGGGLTVSAFLKNGALDRLFLTSAPILVGDGVPGIRFDGSDSLAGALSAPIRRFAFGDDVCTEFDFAAGRFAGTPTGEKPV